MPKNIAALAERVLTAATIPHAIPQLTSEWSDLTLKDAYAVQDAALELRLERGETLLGIKLGLTSRAKQEAMGIDRPTVSWLTDAMLLSSYLPVKVERFIHPRGEPEIAFVTGRDLSGPGVTPVAAMNAVARVHAAIEVIDSRYENFRFRIEDTVADNSSSGGFLMNPQGVSPDGLDLILESVLLEEQGVVVDSATGAAVYGHPAEALAWAVNEIGNRGRTLPAGSIVLTGGMTDAVPLCPGVSIAARFSRLGRVDVRVAANPGVS
jgi:2-oxo-3-hexenedioate decarboxylase